MQLLTLAVRQCVFGAIDGLPIEIVSDDQQVT